MPRWQSCNKTVLMPCCWRNGCCAWYLGTKKAVGMSDDFMGISTRFHKIEPSFVGFVDGLCCFMVFWGFFPRVRRVQNDQLFGRFFFHSGFNHRNVEVWPANIWEMGISDSQIYGFQQQNGDVYICVHWTPVSYSYSDSIGWPHHTFDSWEGSTDHDMVNESDDGKNYQTPL